ncbi:Helix-turn-helix [Paucimonas lemoignei]|jgi:transcriptional regulator with XRE-family HTH domain|nr:Helix-turn-helix [Paucimonas lemoignei]
MQRLQELRTTTLGLSIADFARELSVPEPLVQSWESGTAEPDGTVLRDIATLLGTSVDDLLDFDTSGRKMASRHWFSGEHPILDGFWGHLGLLLPGQLNCNWYPITLSEYSRVRDALATEREEPHWLVVSTLNSRKLIINPEQIQRIRLVDDASGAPEDDAWNQGWDYDAGMVPELYRALGEYHWDSFTFEHCNSASTQALIQKIVDKYQLKDDPSMDFMSRCFVHMASGAVSKIRASGADLYNLVLDAYSGMPLGISLSTTDTEEENHFSPTQVALIEMPLLQYQMAEVEASAEMAGI